MSKIQQGIDFLLASSKLSFAKKLTLSANGNPVIYKCMLNFKGWKSCVRPRIHVCILDVCAFFFPFSFFSVSPREKWDLEWGKERKERAGRIDKGKHSDIT